MFDIINCEANASAFGFQKFYFSNSVKIPKAKDLKDAANYKNKKTLLLLEDYNFDEGSVKLIAEKKKACFLVDLGKVIKSNGISRAILMSKLRTFLRLCVKHGAFYTFASFAENQEEIRKASELMHIIMLFDLNKGQAKFSLKMLQHYI